MPRVRIKYLNFYYTITGKHEEYIMFDEPFTLGQLLHILSESYGPKFREFIFDKGNRLKPRTWIMVSRAVTNDLETELKDGYKVILSVPLAGG